MTNVIAISLNGCLRIRALNAAGTKAVVEIRSHLFPGDWTYCVYRNLKIEAAMEMFMNQARHHVDPNMFTKPVVQPGV